MSCKYTNFVLTGLDAGRRLDSLLKKFLRRSLGASLIYKALRKGDIRLNGEKVSPETLSKEGDILWIYTPLLEGASLESPSPKKTSFSLEIIFQDNNFLIINKPLGALVMPSDEGGEETLKDWILSYLREDYKDSLSFRPAPLHRLDRNTTGVLVFSASLWGAQHFSQALKNHELEKTYLALVEGETPNTFVWIDSLSRDASARKSSLSSFREGKKAITRGRTLVTNEGFSLIEIQIESGITHQIRSSASLHGFPLVGDRKYGSSSQTNSGYYYLHAYSLSFPKDWGLPVSKAPLPKSFREQLNSWTLPKELSTGNKS